MALRDSDKPGLPPIPMVQGEREKFNHLYSLPVGVKPMATILIVAGSDGTPYLSWSNNLPPAGVVGLIGSGLGVAATVIAGDTKPTKNEDTRIITLGGRA